jgi:bifunctional non-homologous end joining protein LigD
MRRGESGRSQWLLIKHRDETADESYDVTAEVMTSVASGRTMEEIAERSGRVWNSNRGDSASDEKTRKPAKKRSTAGARKTTRPKRSTKA